MKALNFSGAGGSSDDGSPLRSDQTYDAGSGTTKSNISRNP